MKKCPYSGAKVFEIFSQLQRRGLAMFLGYQNGEPKIWMTDRTPLCYAPISIPTAKAVLNEVLIREFEGETEVLIGEVLDSIQCRYARRGRPAVALLMEVM